MNGFREESNMAGVLDLPQNQIFWIRIQIFLETPASRTC